MVVRPLFPILAVVTAVLLRPVAGQFYCWSERDGGAYLRQDSYSRDRRDCQADARMLNAAAQQGGIRSGGAHCVSDNLHAT